MKFLFATTGIRGAANKLFTPEYCSSVGRAIAEWKKAEVSRPKVLLAMDTRRSSPMIITALASGFTAQGADVTVLMVPIPTPQLVFLTVREGYDIGVIVTGSHLPASDNGIILIDGDGGYYKGTLHTPESYVPWEDMGSVDFVNNHWDSDTTRKYRDHLRQQYSGLSIPGSVLMDCVHGPMRAYLHEVLNDVFDMVYTINHEDDDTISGRQSEPKPSTLGKTIEYLKETNVDLGIATDLDGDRVIFMTNEGTPLSGDMIGAIFALDSWRRYPDKEVVVPINTSAIIPTLAERVGGSYYYTRVGAPSIIEGIRERDAYFGFEETGKYFFNPDSLYPDGAYSSVVLLRIMAEQGKTLKQMIDELPRFYSLKIKIPSSRLTAPENFARILDSLDTLYDMLPEHLEIDKVSDLDGIRIDFTDRSWILIRQSGTEDNLRIFTESPDKELCALMSSTTKEFVTPFLEVS